MFVQDDEQGDRDDQETEDVDAERFDRVDPLLDLDRRELLGRAFGRLALHERLDDAVHEYPREAQRDERHDDDEGDLTDRHQDVAPRSPCEVGHGR